MVTMKEALAKVDVAQLNDWESERYKEWKDKTWEVSPKQQSVINKMQKLANGSSSEPPKEDTSFEYGANKTEPTRVSDDSVDDMIYKLGVIVEKLSQFDWYNKLPPDAQQKHATTIFLSMRK